MDALFSPEASLASLLAATFLAATIVPLSSEAALFAVLRLHEQLFWPALGVATLGNTLGGFTSYLIGRFIGARKPIAHLERVRRAGAPVLMLAWLPFAGDAICVAAGWLKLNWAQVVAYQAAGRFARYYLVAQGALL
ncbi:MAG: DedA family protein [Betaproteobacteria bacterium]|nr:DedA family protein [Betaproteobacteria bacterium]MBI2960572.1 DedA family protein [Betaproteobacteria bacterium]